jgi:hypothetical protein
VVGIYAASLTLIVGVIFFSERIMAVPHKRELATVTLVIFGLLLLFQVV